MQRGSKQAKLWSKPAAIAATIVTGCLALAVVIVLTNDSGTDANRAGADAGAPFSPRAQSVIARMANMRGWSLQASAETGRCEVLKQVVEHLPAQSEGHLTAAEAAAATGPNGSLYVTMDAWSGGNPQIMRAVQSCTPYFVGAHYGGY